MKRSEYIYCPGCQRFIKMDEADNHRCAHGNCYFVPSITYIPGAEIREALLSKNVKSVIPVCPLGKKMDPFPCPRCRYCEREKLTKEFLKTTVWWYCKYPEEVHVTDKMKVVRGGETDPDSPNLLNTAWNCPDCCEWDTVHYDIKKQVFFCSDLKCRKKWSLDEGRGIFDGFEGYYPPNQLQVGQISNQEVSRQVPNKSEPRLPKGTLLICPNCSKKSLFLNIYDHRFECLNSRCGAVFDSDDKRIDLPDREK